MNRLLSLGPVPQESGSITDADGIARTRDVAGTLREAVADGLLHPRCRHSLLSPHDTIPIRRPVAQVECWATVPGSDKIPWSIANQLAEQIRAGT